MNRNLLKEKDFKNVTGNLWLKGLFGIEKENARVDAEGLLSRKPHPGLFGNKISHPYITTDFSESQVEMITPPLPGIRQAIGFLETIHDIVSLELDGEFLWPQSMPPVLPPEHEIPIAIFEGEGSHKQQYRELLARKYGRKNQMISGIHFNFSWDEDLLKALWDNTDRSLPYEAFREEVYLKTTRQMMRLRWLYILLFGSSPVADPSFELKCKIAPFNSGHKVIGLSLRNSCYGYRNMEELYPDFTSAKTYLESIDLMVKEGKLLSPKELYTSVRPKFLNGPERISYLEFRFIDIDPLSKAGISADALCFLHLLAIYGLFSEETDLFDAAAQSAADINQVRVSLEGLRDHHEICCRSRKNLDTWQQAREILSQMQQLYRDLKIGDTDYSAILERVEKMVISPNQRKIHSLLSQIREKGYISLHLEKARQYLEESRGKSYHFHGLEDMELSTQLLMREAVRRGVHVEILDREENFIRLSQKDKVEYVCQATKTSLDNYVSILAMENKVVTKKILDEHGIRTPKGTHYNQPEVARSDYEYYKDKAIVIKPKSTNFGKGITILKKNNDREVYIRALDIAFSEDSSVMIEEFIEGKEFRIFVLNNQVAGILHRVPANVSGDGIRTIRELVDKKNEDPLRGKGYRTPLEKINLGEAEAMFLKTNYKNFDYIPSKGEIVFLRENSNISTGGDSIDYTDKIPESYKQIAVKAARALNVKITGLDMMIPDYTQEATEDNYAIIEMNFNPAIHIHCHPYQGINRKLDEKIMDMLGFSFSG